MNTAATILLDNPNVSLGMGLLILYMSIFTLTLSHWSFIYFRLGLAPVAVIAFWSFGYGPHAGYASPSVGIYGIMRVLEHSVTSLWDESPPQWVTRSRSADGSRIVLSLPRTSWARCVYAMDLLTSVRGLSWFSELEWSWVSRSLPSQPPIPRIEFIRSNVGSFLVQYILFDMCDIILKLHPWDSQSPLRLVDLPMFQQIIFSTTLCARLILPMTMVYITISSTFVLCGSSPTTWPPLVDSPFFSKSLKEFWSRRWHILFRRVLGQASLPLVKLCISGVGIRANARSVNLLRSFVAFALSTVFHLIIMHRLALIENDRTGRTNNPSFLDGSIIGFFLIQPLGLLTESTIIVPLADWMFPVYQDSHGRESRSYSRSGGYHNGDVNDPVKSIKTVPNVAGIHPPVRWQRDALTRLYAWVFLIWTGRWWCDIYVRTGFLDNEVKAVFVSPLRGLWNGQWVM